MGVCPTAVLMDPIGMDVVAARMLMHATLMHMRPIAEHQSGNPVLVGWKVVLSPQDKIGNLQRGRDRSLWKSIPQVGFYSG